MEMPKHRCISYGVFRVVLNLKYTFCGYNKLWENYGLEEIMVVIKF